MIKKGRRGYTQSKKNLVHETLSEGLSCSRNRRRQHDEEKIWRGKNLEGKQSIFALFFEKNLRGRFASFDFCRERCSSDLFVADVSE